MPLSVTIFENKLSSRASKLSGVLNSTKRPFSNTMILKLILCNKKQLKTSLPPVTCRNP